MSNLSLLVVVFLTGVSLVAAALALAKLLAPRTFNPQKGLPPQRALRFSTRYSV